MTLAASRTLLALFVTFGAPGCGWTAEKPLRPHNGKQTSVDRGLRESWEPSIHLDGRPVDRFVISSNKPTRSHRLPKAGKDSRSHLLEDVDPEWVNLDGFAVLGGAPVTNSSAVTGPVRPSQTATKNHPTVHRATRVNRRAYPLDVSNTRSHRRAPQSSSGPRQPERAFGAASLFERRHQHHTKPQSDQRNRKPAKLTSESVHVVSLQAHKAPGQSVPVNRAVTTKTTTPEPPEYEAKDISVRVMSPQSVLISWVDPLVEMGKVSSAESRSYTVRFREKGESARWEYKDSTQRRMMIDTLSADGMYEFSVRISQGENQGKWSVSVFQRTPESAPSGPPENFEVKPLRGKGTAVVATWDPPEEPNGRIREYILSYAPAMKPFGMKSVTYRGSTTTANIDGLTPGDRYIFKIRATNRRGQGPQSKAFSVAMPGSSSTSSSFSKNKDTRRTSHTPSKQHTEDDESDNLSTEVPTEPDARPQARSAAPVSRRHRPLSQTRSYHSIFSSVRGSVRNTATRSSSRGRAHNREDEEEDEEEITTTPPPVEETTTMEVLVETKEPDNDVSPGSEDGEGYDEAPLTSETPSLKVLTPSPTKPPSAHPNQKPKRPIKIRVHQKPGSKAASSSSASSSTSSFSDSSSSSLPSTSSSSSSSSSSSASSSSQIQESAVSEKDYGPSTYPEGKDAYNKAGVTHSKPSTPVVIKTSSQQSGATPIGRGSALGGRTTGSRYGFSRRYPGILVRGNSTRMLNGNKPAVTSQSNLPSRTPNQAATNTDTSGTSQSTVPDRTQRHGTSHTFNPTTSKSTSEGASSSQAASDAHSLDKSNTGSQTKSQTESQTGSQTESQTGSQTESQTGSQTRSQSRSRGSTTSDAHRLNSNPSTSQSSSHRPSAAGSGSSQSTAHQGSHRSAASQNTHNTESSHASPEQDTAYTDASDTNKNKNSDADIEEPTSSTKTQPVEEERKDDERRGDRASENPVGSRTRISQSFAERFPWLANRYPGRFSSGTRLPTTRQDGRTPLTRTSSSVGAGRPIMRGTRVSGATGAAGVSSIQETSEDVRTPSTHDSLKNGDSVSSVKPTLTDKNTASIDSRNPTTSSTSSPSSSVPTSNSRHSSLGHRDSSESSHRGTSNDSHDKDDVEEGSREISGRNDKIADPEVAQKNLAITPADPDRNKGDNESVDTKATSSRTRTGTSSGITPTHRRPGLGANGRVRSPVPGSRQFAGSRLPVRPQPPQNSRLGSSTSGSSSSLSDSSSSSNSAQTLLASNRNAGTGTSLTKAGGVNGGNSQSTSSSSSSSLRDSLRGQGGRLRYPMSRGKPVNGGALKPANGNGKNGRPNLTDDKDTASSHGISKAVGQRFITGPDGTKWVVDLEQGILMNQDGQVLQDSNGKPKRVVVGEDGRTIFDHMGSPLLNQEGMPLFGHGRDSRPVVNPKDKVLMVGGKPVLGLDLPHLRPSTTTTTTTAPTTTPEPTTTEWTTEEMTTAPPFPTCPPGTFSKTDDYGYPVLDPEGILDCYPEDDFFVQTTLPPTTTTTPTTTSTTTTTTTTTEEITTSAPPTRPHNQGPSSEYDLSGKKRFTAPYVNYIRKDPGAPCSLTEALEYLQVDVLEDLMKKDSEAASQKQPPKNKPHNFTVVAMEGCHSFIILDWARPLKGDLVSGYMVHSASYDDVLNNRWSSRASSGTHLPVENLKPNSRYYFKVQAKNVFGLGPFSETLTYVTESDDPLLIERPPGGEPIWIPFTFKYNSFHSSCKGSQFVKRTWYRKFVGVVLCNSLRYKIFMGDGLREPFYSIGDTFGQGEDHCQFVDSYRDGRTGPAYLSNNLPTAQGFYRAYRQEPVTFGVIGRRTSHPFVGWYECGVPIPGKW
ncbi:fibronectin type III domain-containing protein 1 [Echeneis naucrates]|uniref:fibronectin type III domain-containing protein 1 n=1 Tax=Echeneis naucrates TaxID=173247 RepID=UPI001114628E|nr:fibronectin type III domain-containing protein 1 [Echeneis naucrates]